jgi:hypothetical protein
VGLAAACVLFAVGIVHAVRRPLRDNPDQAARQDLLEAREALLSELVALERARGRAEIGPKSYERVRTLLVDALARILDKLGPIEVPAAGNRRASEAAESAT